MRRRIRSRKIAESLPMVAAAALALAPMQALAQAPRPPHWNVDHGALYCTLARDNGADATYFAMRVIPGLGRAELLMVDRRWQRPLLPAGAQVAIELQAGEPFLARVFPGHLRGSRMLVFLELRATFIDRFAQATQLRVRRGEETVLTLDFPSAGRAVEALRTCVTMTLADWGIDMAAQSTLRSGPEPLAQPFHDSDYPEGALRENSEGITVVRLTIGADGRVSDCAVVRRSGSNALDARACSVYRQQGRFRPAVGADGQPTQAGIVQQVSWRLGR